LQKVFGDRYLYVGLGNTLSLGANSHAAPNQGASHGLDDSDSRSYRALLAQGDDLTDHRLEAARLAQAK
jgi:hypothetical protein